MSFHGTPVVGGGSWLAPDNVRLLQASRQAPPLVAHLVATQLPPPVPGAVSYDPTYAVRLGYALGVVDAALLVLAGTFVGVAWAPVEVQAPRIHAWQQWVVAVHRDLSDGTAHLTHRVSDARNLQHWLAAIIQHGVDTSALVILAHAAIKAVNDVHH